MQISAKERAAFSIANLIHSMSRDVTRGSFETELLHDVAQREGRNFDPRRIRVPWSLLSRDLSATGADTGAYLVGTGSTAVVDALRPWSVTVQAGITVVPNLTGNLTIPRVTGDTSGQWLSSELDAITASQPTLGQVSLALKTAAALVTFTKTLDKLQPNTEPFIRAHLLRVIGQMIDAAVLGGTGMLGQPMGLTGTTGVGTATIDATDPWGDFTTMQAAIATAGAEPTAVIGTPAVRKILQDRSRFANSDSPVWGAAPGGIGGIPAYATTTCPTGKLIAGDWRHVVLGSWGSGIDISTDGFTGWAEGKITVRILAMLDVAVPFPAAFSVASVS